jgi:undecaprenyl-diphosphatase
VIFFWKDIIRVVRAWVGSLRGRVPRGDLDARMGWYVIMATIPIGIFGLIFKHQIETGARNLYLIGTTLIVLGLVLLGVERISKRNRGIESIETKDAVVPRPSH